MTGPGLGAPYPTLGGGYGLSALLLTLAAALALTAAVIALHRLGHRLLRRGRLTGIAPPGHPDWNVTLTLDDEHTLAGIADATRFRPAPEPVYEWRRQQWDS